MSVVALCLILLFAAAEVPAFPNDEVFWEVRIDLDEPAAHSLASQPRKAVPAKLQFGREKPVRGWVKLKGHGSFQPLERKPSFTLQFDHADAPQVPFRGSKIHLNNSVEDSSYLKEKIGAELFRGVGIAVPRVAHARVILNHRELGLYVLKEGFSEQFMQRSFETAAGTIYDSDSMDEKAGAEHVDVDAGSDALGRVKLQELWSAVNQADLTSRFQQFEQVLDLDAFLKFIAMEVLLCHWDGYGLSENNFRIYVPTEGKIQFLPSGMDQIFAKADLTWKPRFSGKVARALMETESAQAQYEDAFKRLLPQVLDASAISKKVAETCSELSPHLTKKEMEMVQAGAKDLRTQVSARGKSLRAQLASPESSVPSFSDGTAVVNEWKLFTMPEGGKMTQTVSNLMVQAGPKTSASWRATVRLPAGRYMFSSRVETVGLIPLSSGNRQGARLRVLGKNTQSEGAIGTSGATLWCEFEVFVDEEVTLICEVRASGGQAQFAKPVRLRQMDVK